MPVICGFNQIMLPLQVIMAESLKEKTAKGLFWGLLNNGTMQVLNLVFGIVLGRLLTPADYALVGLLVVFTAIAGALQESGFTSALTNMEHPSANDYNSVFWFSVIVSIISYTILFFCAPFIAAFYHLPELTSLARFVFLSLLLSAAGTAPLAYMFKNMMVKENTYIRVIALTVSGMVGITLALLGHAYWSLAWQQMVYIALTSAGRFFIITWRPSWHIDFSPVRRMFGFSYKVLITTIVNTLGQNLLTVIFGRLFPAKAVGNFTQAFKWSNMASSLVSGTVAQVAQPVLVKVNNDSSRQQKVFRKMLRLTALIAFPAMFGLAMVAHEFIILTIGEKWIDSILLLRILCIGGAFLPFYTMFQNLVISHGRSDIYMWLTVGLILTQLVLVILCRHHGIIIMTVVYTLLQIAWLAIWQWHAKRMMGLQVADTLKDMMPFMLIAAIVMVVTYIATSPIKSLVILLILRIVMAAVLYVTVMKLLRVRIFDECLRFLLKKNYPNI